MTKKELKEAYKAQKPTIGVFQIRNKVNGKILIEASTDIPAKWNRHRMELQMGSHRNKALQKDWNQGQESDFEFSVLSVLDQKEGENINHTEEVKVLKTMVLEEMELDALVCY